MQSADKSCTIIQNDNDATPVTNPLLKITFSFSSVIVFDGGGGAIYPRIIGRENQNHQPILHILYGVPKFLVVFDGGVQYILGLLVGGTRNSIVMRGASFPEGGPIFLGKIAWGCQISWGAQFPVTPARLVRNSLDIYHLIIPAILYYFL